MTDRCTNLDPVRERFIQEFHATGNATEAFRRAKPHSRKWKPSVVNSKASTMLAEGKVQERLCDLQREAAERHHVTIESLTKELEEAREIALKERQASAAVSASMGKAKLHGLIVDRSETTLKRDATDLDDAELAAIATGRGQRAATAENGAAEPDRVH